MYFPYFRGRQSELLALRDLIKDELLSKSVFPVIEPAKLSTTLFSTIKAFGESQRTIGFILNPEVGEFAGNPKFAETYYSREDTVTDIVPALLMNQSTATALQFLLTKEMTQSNVTAILNKRDTLQMYKEIFTSIPPRYTLFPDERQLKRSITGGKVLFEDKFTKQAKNADYAKCEDEFFSDDHLFFQKENYDGFGDYSVVGDEYSESGFAPYAVAIHIVYFDNENILRVHHFVSDSNTGIENVAGKFYEAVRKLDEWYKTYYDYSQLNVLTMALSTLLSHYKNGTYPGLPSLKKLSIMHHLELISKYLDRGIV